MKLGLSMRYRGYHAAGWRHPDADAAAASKFSHFVRVAQTAEAAEFDMMFLADGIGIRGNDEPPGSQTCAKISGFGHCSIVRSHEVRLSK